MLRCCVVLCLSFTTILAHGDDGPCEIKRQRDISFSSEKFSDLMTVTIAGKRCSKADLRITVRRNDGKRLYRFKGELLDLFPYLSAEPNLGDVVAVYAEKILNHAILRHTSDLPDFAPAQQYYEENNETIEVSRDYYDALRRQRLPILWHITGEASWINVVYDRKRKKVVTILSGGVELDPETF